MQERMRNWRKEKGKFEFNVGKSNDGTADGRGGRRK